MCVCAEGITTLDPATLAPTNSWLWLGEFGGVTLGGALKGEDRGEELEVTLQTRTLPEGTPFNAPSAPRFKALKLSFRDRPAFLASLHRAAAACVAATSPIPGAAPPDAPPLPPPLVFPAAKFRRGGAGVLTATTLVATPWALQRVDTATGDVRWEADWRTVSAIQPLSADTLATGHGREQGSARGCFALCCSSGAAPKVLAIANRDAALRDIEKYVREATGVRLPLADASGPLLTPAEFGAAEVASDRGGAGGGAGASAALSEWEVIRPRIQPQAGGHGHGGGSGHHQHQHQHAGFLGSPPPAHRGGGGGAGAFPATPHMGGAGVARAGAGAHDPLFSPEREVAGEVDSRLAMTAATATASRGGGAHARRGGQQGGRRRRLVLTQTALVERRAGDYGATARFPLHLLHAIVRHGADRQRVTFEFAPGAAPPLSYLSPQRDAIVAAVLDAAQSVQGRPLEVLDSPSDPGGHIHGASVAELEPLLLRLLAQAARVAGACTHSQIFFYAAFSFMVVLFAPVYK